MPSVGVVDLICTFCMCVIVPVHFYQFVVCRVGSIHLGEDPNHSKETIPQDESDCTQALAQFALDDLITGETRGGASKSTSEQGYSVPTHFFTEQEISVCPFPEHITLNTDGMQTSNVKEALKTEGLTAENIDLNQKEHRQIVGKVLLQEMEALFNMKAFHLADTSRADGGAVYGEVTVRDTSSQRLRKAHHSFHIDKFFPGMSKVYNCTDDEAVSLLVNELVGHWWVEDMKRENVKVSEVERAIQNGHAVNVWISLTPGIIEQDPLVLVDPKTIQLSHESFYTMKVHMPQWEDSISLLKEHQTENATFHWIPEMQFGDILIFSTSETPHSAVHILNGSTKPRQSAEMRLVLLENSNVN